MDKNYGGVIWTNHALERLSARNIAQSDALYTFQKPQQSKYAKAQGAWVYYRTYNNERLEVVAKQNEKKEWIILSVWSKPVYAAKPISRRTKQNIILRILNTLVEGLKR